MSSISNLKLRDQIGSLLTALSATASAPLRRLKSSTYSW